MTRIPGALLIWICSTAICAAATPPATEFDRIDNADYLRECGACHLAFPPQLLPARSWRNLMGSLDDHFGETARVDGALRDRLSAYLNERSADDANNRRAQRVMRSLPADTTPSRITDVPYIKGVHAAVLDPLYGGTPRPSHLSQCAACHVSAPSGNFTDRRFHASDKLFASER